jgi:hypothetical protein
MLKTVQLLRSLLLILITTVAQSIQFLRLSLSSRAALSAEVLFLRKQLAFYQERQISPRRLTVAARFSLVLWSRFFHWRDALMIVKPETLIGWHRKGFRLWWRWKSRLGRPRIPENLRRLMVRMVRENPTWAEERVAAELSVKLGILVSPRTVWAYWPHDADPKGQEENLLTALEKLRPESRQGHGGRWFLGGDDGRLPLVVCLRGYGNRHSPHSAL